MKNLVPDVLKRIQAELSVPHPVKDTNVRVNLVLQAGVQLSQFVGVALVDSCSVLAGPRSRKNALELLSNT